MNKHSHKFLSTFAALAFVAAAFAGEPPKIKTPQPSPGATVTQTVGFTKITVKYWRPSVKGREVFGKLEPWGVVWRTGANEATKVTFDTPVKFGGTEVPAGDYALYSIPGEKEWTVILNKAVGEWGAYTYKQENDVVRAKVQPVKLSEPVETFTIDINDIRDDSATLNLIWQKTRVPVKLEFDVVSKVREQIDSVMASGDKLSAGDYFSAATFALEHNMDLAKASQWIDAAIAQRPLFYFYYHKARILAKKGDTAEAKAAAQKSIEMAKAQGGAVGDEYVRLNTALLEKLGK